MFLFSSRAFVCLFVCLSVCLSDILSVNPFFLPSTLVSGSTNGVSEPDSELSARSDIPERSFLRGIRISYEIVLDAAWQVPRF